MSRLLRLGALLVVAASAAACAPTTMYHWGAYDTALHGHYANPTDRAAWVEALRVAILEAEEKGLRVPPGLYAEYGYALLEEGKPQEAIAWFQKEKAKWPESTVLMDKMVRNAGQRSAKAGPTTGPASQAEGRP